MTSSPTSIAPRAATPRAQGRYAEAEPLNKRAVAITERALGPDHPDVGAFLNSVAELYLAQGRYAETEPLFKRSLAIRDKALGPDHPDVAQYLNSFTLLYQAQGRYAEAEPLFKRTLTIYEKALGPDHFEDGPDAPIKSRVTAVVGQFWDILQSTWLVWGALYLIFACDTIHVSDKHPADGIVETAKARGCDLVVMGSHGRRGLQRVLLGSQAAKVLAYSSMAVMICK